MKNLTTITQIFVNIIENNMIYADKTKFIYNLLKVPQTYFLSRPRRFGKSLLLDTINEVFLGNRDIFNGFYIYSSDYNFIKYPIIRLSMDYDNVSEPRIIEKLIIDDLNRIATHENVQISAITPGNALKTLIIELYEKYKNKVVVLIDEYDAPILDKINEPALAQANLEVLHGFYRTLKGVERAIQFSFVTGISQMARKAMGQSVSNLVDLSLDPAYAEICGFTMAEMDQLFSDRYAVTLRNLPAKQNGKPKTVAGLRQMILDWYDGYNFGGREQVLNPFSIMSFFRYGRFDNYWLDSGPSLFLSGLIKKQPSRFLNVLTTGHDESLLRRLDVENLDIVSILYQTGYITIDKIIDFHNKNTSSYESYCYFKLPNKEVRKAYNLTVRTDFFNIKVAEYKDLTNNLSRAFQERDAKWLETCVHSLLSSIPSILHQPSEAFYHGAIHGLLFSMNLDVVSEADSATGRSDVVLILPGMVYAVIELKYVPRTARADGDPVEADRLQQAAIKVAFEQIAAKGYHDPYLAKAKEIWPIGLAVYGRDQVKLSFGQPIAGLKAAPAGPSSGRRPQK
ncbi:MAG: ATP-binding protein [Deltaproteobacteria bacterium]|nr:ATP-binding protein [Deltaproteobacteria bacterium]